MTTWHLGFRLELHVDGERVNGRLCDEQGNESPFSGWLGLLTLLEQARATATSPPGGTTRLGD